MFVFASTWRILDTVAACCDWFLVIPWKENQHEKSLNWGDQPKRTMPWFAVGWFVCSGHFYVFSLLNNCVLLVFCVLGLRTSYELWMLWGKRTTIQEVFHHFSGLFEPAVAHGGVQICSCRLQIWRKMKEHLWSLFISKTLRRSAAILPAGFLPLLLFCQTSTKSFPSSNEKKRQFPHATRFRFAACDSRSCSSRINCCDGNETRLLCLAFLAGALLRLHVGRQRGTQRLLAPLKIHVVIRRNSRFYVG